MKKWFIILLTAFIVAALSACGTSKESSSKDKTNNNENQTESTTKNEETDLESIQPGEPEQDTVCAMCNMKVHTKDDEMGVFTAQAVTQSGETLYFDDIGCILNYDKQHNGELSKKWVRDYDTLEWTELEKSTLVKTDLKSPMKWGYVFFDTEEKANKFIKENSDINPSLANWDDLKNEAYARMEKKMKSDDMKKSDDMGSDDSMNHDQH